MSARPEIVTCRLLGRIIEVKRTLTRFLMLPAVYPITLEPCGITTASPSCTFLSTIAITGDSSPLLMALVVCAIISVPAGSCTSEWLRSRGGEGRPGFTVLATNTVAGFCSSLLPLWLGRPEEVVLPPSTSLKENLRVETPARFAPGLGFAELVHS